MTLLDAAARTLTLTFGRAPRSIRLAKDAPLTIFDSIGIFQFVEQPYPGVPGKKVFLPVNGERTINPASVKPKLLKWNLTIHPSGTIDAKGALHGGTTAPSREESQAILAVVVHQPEAPGLKLRDFHVQLASTDHSWALVGFDAVNAQGNDVGVGLDLMRRKPSGWHIVQGPGTDLEDCSVPAAVRRDLKYVLCN